MLTIAGSDPGAGAGIQADIKTISACNCYAVSAITALTVQNTCGVKHSFAVEQEIVKQQIIAVLEDIGADAVKIGMLANKEIITAVIESLKSFSVRNIVLDTVFISSSGKHLLSEDAIDMLINEMFPLCRIITPNIPEARSILKRDIFDVEDMQNAAKEISLSASNCFPVSVLLKGGHCEGNLLTDVLYNAETSDFTLFHAEKIESENTHGTGCTLSSAIASFLASGFSINDSVTKAKDYINNAILEGKAYKIGNGKGPLCHFNSKSEIFAE